MGVNTLAAALAEETEAIEEIYEPFLIQIGIPRSDAAWTRRNPAGVEHSASRISASRTVCSSSFTTHGAFATKISTLPPIQRSKI